MPSAIQIKVIGLKETQHKMEQVARDLTGDELLTGMRHATLLVVNTAKQNTPVDTGLLRASITPSVTVRGNRVVGIVGSNVSYAPYVELGTRPHWPPVSALEVWARRHGTSAFLVARAISQRGTKAHHMLEKGLTENEEKIVALIGEVVAKIVNR